MDILPCPEQDQPGSPLTFSLSLRPGPATTDPVSSAVILPSRPDQQLLPPDQRLSRSQSDMFPPRAAALPGAQDTPQRVNPFSQRQDLKGGRIKLFDTPSKSLISLAFELPPPSPFPPGTPITPEPAVEAQCNFSEPLASLRRCHSLPASPELPCRGQLPRSDCLLAMDCGRLSPPSSSASELMDCSPDPEPAVPTLAPTLANGNFISTAVSGAHPWPPNGLLLNNNSEPPGWGRGLSELSVPPTVDGMRPEHAGAALALSAPGSGGGSSGGSSSVLEQEEVLSCPACCLGPFSFSLASVCHRPPATGTPRYQNLNRESRGLLCPDRHQQHPQGPGAVLAEPSLKLPEAQS